MVSHRFERRRFTRPESPLEAVIGWDDGMVEGFVDHLTLDGLHVKIGKRGLNTSKEHVRVDLFLSASNGPALLTLGARILDRDETGISLQFRPMALSDHQRLRAIMAFLSEGRE